MAHPLLIIDLQMREAEYVTAIDNLEKKIREHHMYVSRDQLRIWNRRIQELRSKRIALRTLIAMCTPS